MFILIKMKKNSQQLLCEKIKNIDIELFENNSYTIENFYQDFTRHEIDNRENNKILLELLSKKDEQILLLKKEINSIKEVLKLYGIDKLKEME